MLHGCAQPLMKSDGFEESDSGVASSVDGSENSSSHFLTCGVRRVEYTRFEDGAEIVTAIDGDSFELLQSFCHFTWEARSVSCVVTVPTHCFGTCLALI